MSFAPLFIIGVPRSGTTLLRVLLDSHSQIAALPESPWLLGAYGPDTSLRGLMEDLIGGPYGAVKNVAGVTTEDVLAAGRQFLEALFTPVLEKRQKRMLVFKTPHDIRHLDFLTKFMPDARYIHITRDGRDVCMSQLAKKGSFFRDLKEFGRLSYANTFRRWADWEQRVRATLYRENIKVIGLRYEDLVADPAAALRRITDFLDIPFEARMLDYASSEHDYPRWEAGASDVAKHGGISAASLGKWRQAEMTTEMLYTLKKYDPFLVSIGYPSSNLSLSFSQHITIALFAAAKPLFDAASAAKRNWHSRLRDQGSAMARVVAGAAMLGLALHFLLPLSVLDKLNLVSHADQAVLSALAALCVEASFWPALLRRSAQPRSNKLAMLKAAGLMLTFVGMLELAQGLIPDRHARFIDFVGNAAAVILTTCVMMPLLSWAQSRLRAGRAWETAGAD